MNKKLLAALILGILIVGPSIGSTVQIIALRLYQAGASNTQIGIMSALPAAGMMLSALLVDWLCLKLSWRQIYLLRFSLCALSIGDLEIPNASVYTQGLVRTLMGPGTGRIIILGETWVNEMASEATRGRIIAVYTTYFTVFQLIGPGMVALLGTDGPYVLAIVTGGSLLAIAVIWLTLLRYRVARGCSLSTALGLAVGQSRTPGPLPRLRTGIVGDRLGLPLSISYPTLLWPSLVILGAAAGGVYTLAIILIGQKFSGPDLITANASAGLLWGIGSLLAPLFSGAAMSGSSTACH